MISKSICTTLITILIQLVLFTGFVAISKGPKYVLLYGFVISSVIAIIRKCTTLEKMCVDLITLCTTSEQQERLSIRQVDLQNKKTQ